MDARLSTEQRELRAAAAKLADDLGPHSVLDLSHADRVARLEKAVGATGWRSLRSDGASGVEVALVAEEFARGLVDVPFVGPALADGLRPSTEPTTIATRGAAFDARGFSRALTLDDRALFEAPVGDTAVGVDLTRRTAASATPGTAWPTSTCGVSSPPTTCFARRPVSRGP
jgi:hypothetical protein